MQHFEKSNFINRVDYLIGITWKEIPGARTKPVRKKADPLRVNWSSRLNWHVIVLALLTQFMRNRFLLSIIAQPVDVVNSPIRF
jgi:hypothetical protein